MHFAQAGSYSIEYLASGHVQIKVDGGKATVIKAADYAAVTTFTFAPGAVLAGPIRIDGVTFTEAGPGGPFEISHNLDALIGNLFTHGVDHVLQNLLINGSRADTIKAVWDYLDDFYVAGTQYNEAFVRLGIAYVNYIESGGTPFTGVTAKFTPDGPDADLIPERNQTMHDNLLGNLTIGAINGRFAANPALKAELLALIPNEYEARLLYEGTDGQFAGPRHDNVRTFDWDKGWSRDDYLDLSFGKVDLIASDDRNNDGVDEQMFYGQGNSNDAFNIVRHEGAGVELALKAKEYGPNGGDYGASSRFYDAAGVLHYNVSSGASPDHSGRADWSLDYAATVLSHGADESWTFRLLIDIDETEGVNLVEIPMTTYSGLKQGSSNYGFAAIRDAIDIDDSAQGIQSYAFGPGEFDIVLEAYAGGVLVASNHIVVHVDGFGI
jgi:hypothetical protein